MTERLIGETGSRKRRRFTLLPVAALIGLTLLLVASQAIAADPDAGAYTIVTDENGANDVPGQKDLTLQGVEYNRAWRRRCLQGALELGRDRHSGGNNSMDACTFFDTARGTARRISPSA